SCLECQPANKCQRTNEVVLLLLLIHLLLPVAVFAQGSGRESTGTGGAHSINGKIFFPSGRRAEGTIKITLQSYVSGELSTLADVNGSFTFTSLAPGNYTVIVNAGPDYEIARENVTIENDLNVARGGVSMNPTSRRYTVMVTLQPKRDPGNSTKASVVNAALAEVPEQARGLYQKALELAKMGDSLKAIDNLKVAISLYPKFPLALNELGVQYLKLGQAVNAIEPLKSAVKLSPDASTPKLNLGVALLEAKYYADAAEQLRDANKINSTPTGHMYLGLALAHLSKDAEAEKELKAAIDSSNNQLALAHYYLGGVYWQMATSLQVPSEKQQKYNHAADE